MVLRLLGLLVALLVGLALFVVATLSFPRTLEVPERGGVLRDVTVVNPGLGRLEHQDVVVEGGTIVSIEPASEPGMHGERFLLPGLADAHVHFPPAAIPGQGELFAFLYIAHGVTSVRDAGDVDGTATAPAIEAWQAGTQASPRIWSCGPFIDGPETIWANSVVVETPDAARAAVRELKAQGKDCVKAYNSLAREVAAAVHEEAQKQGLPVIGHVSWNGRYEDGVIDDVQHMTAVARRLGDGTVRYPEVMAAWPRTDEAHLAEIAAVSREKGIANTPTLATNDRAGKTHAQLAGEPDLRLLPRFYRDVIWNQDPEPEALAILAASRAPFQRAVRFLHEAGVEIRTGTDALANYAVPGASLQRELRLLVEAGFTPEEAWRLSADTANALGGGRLGFVEPGAPADLVLLGADPTVSLDALATIEAVVADGRFYAREDLDEQLHAYQEAFEGAVYEAITVPIVRRVLGQVEE